MWDAAPDRLRRGVDAALKLRDEGIYLAPIRHHSPACAHAVQALIEEVQPRHVLIEGPEEYGALVGDLLNPATRPPIAILSLGSEDGKAAGFFPLADFSPEWVALHAAHAVGAEIAFIDQSWSTRAEPSAKEEPDSSASPHTEPSALARTLQAEQELARSASIAALAARLGCRDHDDVWDHLFEARERHEFEQWRTLFDDVLAWAGLARLDTSDEVLLLDGTLDREVLMSARVEERRKDGPVVVVTGAFHTLAIVEALAGLPDGKAVTERRPAEGYGEPVPREAWLVRYDFARLDALRGYGAGMPSPGYYQRLWDAGGGSVDQAIDVLVSVGDLMVKGGGRISVAEISSAAIQAEGLARLRQRPWPARTDILDALTSCFVKDDGGWTGPLKAAVAQVLTGRGLGELPATSASPPVVSEARSRARELRLTITDSVPRLTRLDSRRNPRHRERSRFLALMDFVGTHFAHQVSGPDLVAGRGLDRVIEEWEYAWTPMVEAALVEIAQEGATLQAIALARLARMEQQAQEAGRSAQSIAELVAQAVAIGAETQVPRLIGALARMFDVDPSLESVVGATRRIVNLWDARVELGVEDLSADLGDLVGHGLAAAAYLVDDLGAVKAEEEDNAVGTLLSLHELCGSVSRLRRHGPGGLDTEPIAREFRRLRNAPGAAPGVRGALLACAVLDGEANDDEAVAGFRAQLEVGTDPVRAVRFLGGALRAAPDLLVHSTEMFDALHEGLRDMEPDAFLSVLPDLRRAFTWLKPAETHAVAGRVARTTGSRVEEIDRYVTLTEEDLMRGTRMEQALAAALIRDGLEGWVTPS